MNKRILFFIFLILLLGTLGIRKYLKDTNDKTTDIATESNEVGESTTDIELPEMILVTGGIFQMGSNKGDMDENPVHEVTIGDFYIGKYEVTVAQFEQFIKATDYQTDAEKKGESAVYTEEGWTTKTGVSWKDDEMGNPRPVREYERPVIHLSWNDAITYCNWLSSTTGKTYRLPTEAEWEYAAKGGNKGEGYEYAGGDDIEGVAWYIENSDETLHAIKQKRPNEIGVYDMSGNVWEWCSDWYGMYIDEPTANPKGADSGTDRIFRGGSWSDNAYNCRITDRNGSTPDYRDGNLGFRLVLVL